MYTSLLWIENSQKCLPFNFFFCKLANFNGGYIFSLKNNSHNYTNFKCVQLFFFLRISVYSCFLFGKKITHISMNCIESDSMFTSLLWIESEMFINACAIEAATSLCLKLNYAKFLPCRISNSETPTVTHIDRFLSSSVIANSLIISFKIDKRIQSACTNSQLIN